MNTKNTSCSYTFSTALIQTYELTSILSCQWDGKLVLDVQ